MTTTKFSIFGQVNDKIAATVNSNQISEIFEEGKKQALLVNSVAKTATGWQTLIRVNISRFTPGAVFINSEYGTDTHAVFNVTFENEDLTEKSLAVLESYDEKLSQLSDALKEDEQLPEEERLYEVSYEDVFKDNGQIDLTGTAGSGIGFPSLNVSDGYIAFKIEYVKDDVVNPYHKVNSYFYDGELNFTMSSGGAKKAASEEEFFAEVKEEEVIKPVATSSTSADRRRRTISRR
jgi:hypothetical protein